ncbi:MAG: hypothetical protein ACI4U2_00540 [Christensenellaceae bacterium]
MERSFMEILCKRCLDRGSCLLSPAEFPQVDVGKKLSELESEGYLEYVASERKGERVFVVTMKNKGFCYLRESRQQQRQIAFRLTLAACCAVVSFLVGLLLRSFFR